MGARHFLGCIYGHMYERTYGHLYSRMQGCVHGRIYGCMYGRMYGRMYVRMCGSMHAHMHGHLYGGMISISTYMIGFTAACAALGYFLIWHPPESWLHIFQISIQQGIPTSRFRHLASATLTCDSWVINP